jgi:GTP:adenosylcobinamide-phosphate guanylyltransferase
MAGLRWQAVILAAGRGPDDPMARAFGIAHKCLLPVAGKPMLLRVVEALARTSIGRPFTLSIEHGAPVAEALGPSMELVARVSPEDSAPASALAAIGKLGRFPVLITTGDHPLLTPAIIEHFTTEAAASSADVLAALASGDTIRAAYPETRRTYFKLAGTDLSGCNLFAVMNERGLRLVERWRHIERNRKHPLRLVTAFGLVPLLEYLTGRLTPERAFTRISRKLGIVAQPVFMPFAEAAIDVDKPDDLVLAERILRSGN